MLRIVLVIALLLSPATAALGQDLVKDSIPARWIQAYLPEELPDLEFPAYFNDLDKTQAQAFAGRYKLSLITLQKVAEGDPARIALIKGTAQSATGKKSKAIETLSAPPVADDPRVQILRAQVLAEMGKNDLAIAGLKEHLQRHPDSFAGWYLLGEVSERAGDLATASQCYAWFVDSPQSYLEKWQSGGDPKFDDAANVTYFGRALDRWATITGAYQNSPHLHDLILNVFVKAYDEIDRSYWPAHVAAAEYFRSHDQRGEAGNELEAAMAANPNDPRTQRLYGEISLEVFHFDGADQMIAALRNVNRKSVDADLLEARNLLLQKKYRQAESPLDRVLAEQPKNLTALGLLAAAKALQTDDAGAKEILKRVEQIDPHNATAYNEAGEQLAAAWQYPRAEAMFKIAIERAPWWNEPRNGLGILYTQNGDEDLARATLDAAHNIDPFNLRTTNYLRVLDQMGRFERSETEHFILLYDPVDAAVVPTYFGPAMEKNYREVCDAFKHEPARKTMLEVFPTVGSFSVRTAGVMGAETFGASFGPVMTAVAPRPGQTLGRFNWNRVLRHEFTHVMNMSQTQHRCPRWLTEGLAVWQEGVDYRFAWVPPVLYESASTGKMFPLSRLDRVFLRPEKSTDGEMAYMQGFWIVLYMRESAGPDSIIKLLEAYKAGNDDAGAIHAATGKDLATFEKDFFAWARDRVSTWGYDAVTQEKFDKLAERADGLVKAGKNEDALKLWEEARELQPMNSLPHRRLAGLYLRMKEPAKALPHLEALIPLELQDNTYPKRVARIYRDQKDLGKAEYFAYQAIDIDPYDVAAHELLAEIYKQTGNADGETRELRTISALSKSNRPATQESLP